MTMCPGTQHLQLNPTAQIMFAEIGDWGAPLSAMLDCVIIFRLFRAAMTLSMPLRTGVKKNELERSKNFRMLQCPQISYALEMENSSHVTDCGWCLLGAQHHLT